MSVPANIPGLNFQLGDDIDALRDAVRDGFSVTLIDGVTGSGKTEVYLEAVAAALAEDPGSQVLILLPEIALTQAVMARVDDALTDFRATLGGAGQSQGLWISHAGVARCVQWLSQQPAGQLPTAAQWTAPAPAFGAWMVFDARLPSAALPGGGGGHIG